MLRKPLAIYAKYSKKKKKSSFDKNIQRKLAGAEIKSRTNCTNRLQEVPAFWRSLSRKLKKKKKKKKNPEFRAPILFLEDFFFSFFFYFFSTGATDFTEKKKLVVFHYTKYHT